MNKKGLTLLVVLVAVVVVAVFGIALATNTADVQASCVHTGQTYTVVIKDDKLQPTNTTAQQCDILKIVNQDALTREIGFGNHDHHQAYDGVSEKLLRKDMSFSVTLNKTGTYHFHDHFHDEVAGSFTIN